MRSALGLLALLPLAQGCDRRTDAERYTHALTDAATYEDARDSCLGIAGAMSRGDCLVAAMERFDRLAVEDCDAMHADVPEMALWRDECRFLLAERQRGAGELGAAIATCEATRFQRQCLWHLVQDEAEHSVDEDAAAAEARVAPFAGSRRLPDAGVQFWTIRTRTRAAAGHPPDERDCQPLADPEACFEGLRRYIRLTLDTRARTSAAAQCDVGAGDRGTVERAAWFEGPVARDTVARWRALHCREGEAPGQRPPAPRQRAGAPGPPSR